MRAPASSRSPLKNVCHCFAEAVRVVLPDENTASAKQWHTVSGNRYFFNGRLGRRSDGAAEYFARPDAVPAEEFFCPHRALAGRLDAVER